MLLLLSLVKLGEIFAFRTFITSSFEKVVFQANVSNVFRAGHKLVLVVVKTSFVDLHPLNERRIFKFALAFLLLSQRFLLKSQYLFLFVPLFLLFVHRALFLPPNVERDLLE